MDNNREKKNKGADKPNKVASFLKRTLGEVVEFNEGGAKAAKPPKPAGGDKKTKPAKPGKPANKPAAAEPAATKALKDADGEKSRRKERRGEKQPSGVLASVNGLIGKFGSILGTNAVDDDEAETGAKAAETVKNTDANAAKRPAANAAWRESEGGSSGFLPKFFLAEKKHRYGIIAAAVLLFCLAFYLFWEEEEDLPTVVDYTPIYVNVKGGMAATQIGRALEEKEIIVNAKQFLRRARRSGNDAKFQSGVYRFHKGMRNAEVIEMLVNGKTSVIRFTIPEGYSLREMAQKFEKEGILKAADFMAAAKKYVPFDYIDTNPDIPYFCEGYLFPDTYEVQPGVGAQHILTLMARTFDKRFTKEMRDTAKRLNLTPHEFVTLASLVEKEAMYDEDRPIIAQVFLKRLRIGMMLQSDAPIQYLRDTPKEDLTFEDLKVDSPYNTYKHYGLPPGPIASPGLAALNAIVRPADTDYLYFVADRQGHNHYSTNYSEHQALTEKYR